MTGTTKRIFLSGSSAHSPRIGQSDFSFLKVCGENNPRSHEHWLAAVTNNPGGAVPNFNPSLLEECLDIIRAALRT